MVVVLKGVLKVSCSLSWLWGDFSQQESSSSLAVAIRRLPLHLLRLFSSAVLAVNTPTELPLSLPVLSSHRRSKTYTSTRSQEYVCQSVTAHCRSTFVCACMRSCVCEKAAFAPVFEYHSQTQGASFLQPYFVSPLQIVSPASVCRR